MIEKEDLAEQGIEAERTDVDKRNIVNKIGQSLRKMYSNRHEYMAIFEDEMETTIKMNIWIQPIAGLMFGKELIAMSYTLMLGMLLFTAKIVDSSERVENLDEMSGRVGRCLKVSALIIGAIATANLITPTASLILVMMLGWVVIWTGSMWLLLLITVIWGTISDLSNLIVRKSPF